MAGELANLGLLSRMGPATMMPGLLDDSRSIAGFSTNTLLGLARPIPETGDLFVPYVHDEHLRASVLSSSVTPRFRELVGRLFEEGKQITQDQERWGLAAPYSLPFTEGAWFIFDYEVTDEKRHLCFKSLGGRILAFDWHTDNRLDVEAGWFRGAQSSAKQKVSIGPLNDVSTVGYSVEFYHGGVAGLGVYLGLSKPTGTHVLMKLGKAICDSGQYPSFKSRKVTKSMLTGGSGTYDLKLTELNGKEETAANIHFHMDRRQGHLTLDLHRLSSSGSARMPLAAKMRDVWNGAIHHLHAYPY